MLSRIGIEAIHTNRGLAKLGKLIDKLSDFFGMLSGIFLLACALIVFWQVIARRIFHQPTSWEPDITVYLLIWIGFLASGFGLKEGSHVIIDTVVDRMTPKVRAALDLCAYFLTTVYASIFTVYSIMMTIGSFRMKETAFTELRMPIGPVKLGLVVGMFILTLQALRMFISKSHTFHKERSNLKGGEGILNNPLFVVIIFAALLVSGVWCYEWNPLVGSLIVLMALLAAGIPVAFSLSIVGAVGLVLLLGGTRGLINIPVMGFSQVNSFTLVALPLFLIGGSIMASGGLAEQLFDVATAFVGHLPGGLGVATIGACAIFAAISGSSVANAATIGMVAIPILIKKGYDKRLVCGIVAGGGTLGILIPPSNQMIIYAILTEESLGHLFMAGLIPGIILAAIFAIWIVFSCWRSGKYTPEPWVPWRTKFRTVKKSAAGLGMPIIILGLIYTGIVTPTEAAAVAVIYALVVSLIKKTIKWRDLLSVLTNSTKTTTMVFMMIIGSVILGGWTSMLQFTEELISVVADAGLPTWLILVMMMAFLIVLGTYLEPIAITFLFVPVVTPLLNSLHIDLVWFAVLLTINMEMAIISPPVGTNLNVVQQVSGVSYLDVCRGIMPFIIIMAMSLILFGLFPQLSLWLPGTMGR